MVAPLTRTRNNKRKLLKGIISDALDILLFPKGCLDLIDFRLMKKLSKNLKEYKERAKPV